MTPFVGAATATSRSMRRDSFSRGILLTGSKPWSGPLRGRGGLQHKIHEDIVFHGGIIFNRK